MNKIFYLKFFLLACIALPLRLISDVASHLLGERKIKSWSLVGTLLWLPLWRKVLITSEKKFKAMTIQLNKSNRGLAFKTICVVLGLILIISAI